MAAEAILVCGAADILKKLISIVTEEIVSVWGVKDEMEKLQIMLNMNLAIIADAEKRQIKGEAVKLWLKRLKDLSDVAHKILDDYFSYQMNPLVMDKVWNYVSPSIFNPLIFRFKMAHRIKAIKQKLDEIAKEKVMFTWQKISLDPANNMIMMSTSTTVVDESREDEDNLMETYPPVDSSKNIVGMETDPADLIGRKKTHGNGEGEGEQQPAIKNGNIPDIRLYAGTLFWVMLTVLVRQLWVLLRSQQVQAEKQKPVLKAT